VRAAGALGLLLVGAAGHRGGRGDEVTLVVDQQHTDERQDEDDAPDEQRRPVDREGAHGDRRGRHVAGDDLQDDEGERARDAEQGDGHLHRLAQIAGRERLHQHADDGGAEDEQ
jgi:hypothetical protein